MSEYLGRLVANKNFNNEYTVGMVVRFTIEHFFDEYHPCYTIEWYYYINGKLHIASASWYDEEDIQRFMKVYEVYRAST